MASTPHSPRDDSRSEDPALGDFLAEPLSEELSAEERLGELADRFARAVRVGQAPSVEVIAARYPDLESDIRELFPTLAALEGAAESGSSPQGLSDRTQPTLDATVADPRTLGAGHTAPLVPGSLRGVPRQLADYTIVREIGRGGMGVVYEARQHSLGRRVAVKVLPPGANLDSQFLERFRLEAQAAGRLEHPGIVPVYGTGDKDGLHYYAMQYISGFGLDRVVAALTLPIREFETESLEAEGVEAKGIEESDPLGSPRKRNLAGSAENSGSHGQGHPSASHSLREVVDHLRQTSLQIVATPGSTPGSEAGSAPEEPSSVRPRSGYGIEPFFRNVASIGFQVARALAYAHGQGVLHRDIKPSNLLLDSRGRAWITDFGLCKTEGSESLTAPGALLGTFRYMAPEAFSGKTDVRSDVYGLGVTLFELLTGRPAFDSTDRAVLMRQVTEGHTSRCRSIRRDVPADLDTIVAKAMAVDPKDRYPTAEALAQDVRAFLENRPIAARASRLGYVVRLALRRHRGAAWASAIGLIALIGVVGFFVIRLGDRARDILRLADLKRLDNAIERAEQLWPALPSRIPELSEWLDEQAYPLYGRLDQHRAKLEELRALSLPYSDEEREYDRRTHAKYPTYKMYSSRIEYNETKMLEYAPGDARIDRRTKTIANLRTAMAKMEKSLNERRTWSFEDQQLQWWHDALSDLVDRLEIFGGDDLHRSAIRSIEARLEFALEVDERSRTSPEARRLWQEAAAAIVQSPHYAGLELKPQLGLLPLGENPRSGLWEFWHLASGDRPEPTPDPEAVNRWVITPETGIVFVLIPAADRWVGAERPRLGVVLGKADEEPGLLIESVQKQTLSSTAGVVGGDRLMGIDDHAINSISDIRTAIQGASAGDPVQLRVRRAGQDLVMDTEFPPWVDRHALTNENVVWVEADAFFISKYETTQGQWIRLTGENPTQYNEGWNVGGKGNSLINPADRVSHTDAKEHIRRWDLRLPSEDQWEVAARGGTHTPWWSGSDEESIQTEKAGNLADEFARRNRAPKTWLYESWLDDGWGIHSPVGTFTENPFGLHDTIGNVLEWTDTQFGSPREKALYVTRGGCFADNAERARVSKRSGEAGDLRVETNGVRLTRPIRKAE